MDLKTGMITGPHALPRAGDYQTILSHAQHPVKIHASKSSQQQAGLRAMGDGTVGELQDAAENLNGRRAKVGPAVIRRRSCTASLSLLRQLLYRLFFTVFPVVEP
jgi:hypothetical protein